MPEFNTLNDIIRFNDKNVVDFGVSNVLKKTPYLNLLSADYASNGIVDYYKRELTLPTVGYRTFNDGAAQSVGTSETVTTALSILAESASTDKAEADVWRNGPEAKIKDSVSQNLAAGFLKTARQVLYGQVAGDATGHTGLADFTELLTASAANVINAGSASGSTNTDIWFICTGPQDVQLILGQDGIVKIGESVVTRASKLVEGTPNTQKYYPIYYTPVEGFVGVRLGSTFSAYRIVNVGASANKATDALIYSMLDKMAAKGKTPDMIVMHPRSLGQIRDNRVATSPTGAAAVYPTDIQGIPLVSDYNVRADLAVIS